MTPTNENKKSANKNETPDNDTGDIMVTCECGTKKNIAECCPDCGK